MKEMLQHIFYKKEFAYVIKNYGVRGSQMEGSCSGTGTVAGFGICGNELSSS